MYNQYQQGGAYEPMVFVHWFVSNIQGNLLSIGSVDPTNGNAANVGEELIPFAGLKFFFEMVTCWKLSMSCYRCYKCWFAECLCLTV